MADKHSSPGSGISRRGREAEELLAQAFEQAGWRVSRQQPDRQGHRPDFLVRRPAASYAVKLKLAAEGRSDRLIPLWSQSYIQAARVAGEHVPLAVVAAPKIAPRVARNVLDFAERYAPNAAVGVIDLVGLRLFRGPHLEDLNALVSSAPGLRWRVPGDRAHLFSDLNQWMLKVLLAPELPPELLSAPRGNYQNASQLAGAARVSVMSAFRFLQLLRRQGYLHESAPHFRLVRRDDLFKGWQASALRSYNEAPMRFLLPGRDPGIGIRQLLKGNRACMALFAAAEELGFGHVGGVPSYLYVRRLAVDLSAWKNVVLAEAHEVPDLIVRQAPAPESVFRGMVRPRGLASCDILQVWLDVGGHPSRGQEQADFIRQGVLGPVLRGDHRG
ncbi:MAG TPA: hypothetical protein VFE84_07410 [Patescibacteria group bacterium]|jgi:hypothetical protein|nr:hypothetical protein [Patescibacteria group bacterium]